MLLFQLPEDVLYHILSYLDCRSLRRLSGVCKAIYPALCTLTLTLYSMAGNLFLAT
uniref:F-box domain-containing protein n=1 Tax=Monopterus albus TaxID=43700 RepID=A0A3Q3QBL5_MONAL